MMAEPLESDTAFFTYCERRHRDNVVRFLRAVTQYKAAMLQPLGGRTASSILAEEIVGQYIDPRGPLCVRITPGTRESTLERWRALVASKDFSRLQRTFFDRCRAEVVDDKTGELAELAADYRTHAARLAAEAREAEQQRRVTISTTAAEESVGNGSGNKSSVFGTVLSSLRKSSETLSSMALAPKSAAEKGGSSGSLPGSRSSVPLVVKVAGKGDVMELQVDLMAADTHLSWNVERSAAEFKELHAALRRYKVWVAPLPKQEKKLETWLHDVLQVAELSASRDVYAFLNIGRTVDLLAQAARAKRSTIAVQRQPEDELALLSQDDLAQALGNLELLQDDRPALPNVGSNGSIRARKAASGDVSAEDIAAALKHLLGLQFTDSPLKTAEEEELERQLGGRSDDERGDGDDDREEESTEAESNSAPSTVNTFDDYPLDTSGGSLLRSPEAAAGGAGGGSGGGGAIGACNNKTADFDLRAIVADQARTIEALQRRVAELEAQLAGRN